MLHLLQLEWKKFKRYTPFIVIGIMYLVVLPSMHAIFKTFGELPPEIMSKDDFYKFPTLWPYLGYIGNWASFFFLGFIGVLMITMEYQNKTLRQNIITGMSRKQFFTGKILVILTVSLLATLYFALVGVVYGLTHTNNLYFTKIVQNWEYIPRYFLMCVGYTSFGFFLGVLIRRTGIALFVYLTYIMFVELALRWLVHMQIFAHKSMHFYPMNAVEDLAPMPLVQQADGFLKEFNFSFFLTPTEAAITTIIYTSLFLYLAYRKLKRSNL